MTDLIENIGLDLLLPTGIMGLALFLSAPIASPAHGFAPWRRYLDHAPAVLAP